MKSSTLRFFALVNCLVFVLALASCKKESKPASELIRGKWTITSQYYYLHVGGQNSTQPIETAAGSYYEFKDDGQVIIQTGESGPVEYDYAFQSGNIIRFSKPDAPSKLLTVMSINASKLVLGERQSSATGDYSETRVEMSK